MRINRWHHYHDVGGLPGGMEQVKAEHAVGLPETLEASGIYLNVVASHKKCIM